VTLLSINFCLATPFGLCVFVGFGGMFFANGCAGLSQLASEFCVCFPKIGWRVNQGQRATSSPFFATSNPRHHPLPSAAAAPCPPPPTPLAGCPLLRAFRVTLRPRALLLVGHYSPDTRAGIHPAGPLVREKCPTCSMLARASPPFPDSSISLSFSVSLVSAVLTLCFVQPVLVRCPSQRCLWRSMDQWPGRQKDCRVRWQQSYPRVRTREGRCIFPLFSFFPGGYTPILMCGE
jgi:hypothetical protein